MTPVLAAERSGNFVDLDVHAGNGCVLLGLIVGAAARRPPGVPPRGPRGQHQGGGHRVGRVDLDRRGVHVRGRGGGSAAPAGGEYISGYLIEKSLSVDNVFVWALIMGYFARAAEVPAPGAVLGHLRGARAAGDLHLRRRRADRDVRLDPLRVRCVPAVHRRASCCSARTKQVDPGNSRFLKLVQPGRSRRTDELRRASSCSRRSTAGAWRRRCSPCSCWSRRPT